MRDKIYVMNEDNSVYCKIKSEPFINEYISVDFIKSFLDPVAFNNKNVWEDDEYLEENYPVQHLIKKLLQ